MPITRGNIDHSYGRFGNFFSHVDNFPDEAFLFVTSGGIEASKARKGGTTASTAKDALAAIDGSDGEDGMVGLGNAEDGEG